ncbi:DUF3857 domain-containing protein [Flavobacterium quisquiliarum]|uniref:DUF3857 domain-containing protein n=1 Tax=Flavobacterium quisquiliarum TaxID=1834436 RepID=A0ABV8W9B7_9FLAO|nr:DUF3857 domain-containing protein [Flavobacterium quisquiliarum]MBW1658062.1 DUF3857 domain-containing protein [Flavobacterium quisquiliarum]
MRARFLLICFVFFWNNVKVLAQKYELGKVTVAELQEKVHPIDSSAPAAILFKKGKTIFTYNYKTGFSAVHTYEFKIKIYKKEGLKWADQKVQYYVGYQNLNEDLLSFSNAVTYNLENGKIEKTKLENQGTFKRKINEYWNEKGITFPNVKVGSILEYKYVLKSENIVQFPDFDFQFSIPVNYFEYKTQFPEFYIYKALLVGTSTIENTSKIVSGSQSYENEYGQSRNFLYQQIDSFYSGKDIPALKEEPYVNNIENYRGSIKHELERVRMPEQPVKDYTITWEGVASTIFKDDHFGKEINKNSFLLEDVKKILANVQSPKERMNVIFQYVQNKMNWNEKNSYYTDKGVEKAYTDQTGNIAEINFILLNMLKWAGIEANPVLVSTVENGVPVYPTRTGFNYVIVAAEIDEKQVLLDASRKFTSPDILPLNTLNWKGRLIKSDGTSKEIDLVPIKPSKENASITIKLNEDGKINGKVRIQRTDYEAYKFRVQNGNRNQDSYLEKLEQQLGDLKISDYGITNKISNISDPIVETFSFETNNFVESIGGKLYISPMLFYTPSKNPFVQENRQMGIYFGYPKQEKLFVNIDIPEGYTIEILPKPTRLSLEENAISLSLNVLSEGNKIQFIFTKDINNSIFAAEHYNALKTLFQKMLASQNEKIILKKA